MTTMNPEVKAKWLEALRSGEYEQGKRDLRSKDDKFCCLGVLCDLAVKEGVISEPALTDYGSYAYGPEGHQHDTAGLPELVIEWSGGVRELGERGADKDALAFVNDSGVSFEEIADIIEKEF